MNETEQQELKLSKGFFKTSIPESRNDDSLPKPDAEALPAEGDLTDLDDL